MPQMTGAKFIAETAHGFGITHVFFMPDTARRTLMEMEKTIPFQDGYRHMEGNSAAHIKSSLFGCSATVIIESGRLMLGTWQSIFFCEFDGPRNRNAWIKILES